MAEGSEQKGGSDKSLVRSLSGLSQPLGRRWIDLLEPLDWIPGTVPEEGLYCRLRD